MTEPAGPIASSEPDARLRDRLRAETRGEHEALDALFADMLEPGSGDLYTTFLRMNREAHRAIEPLLAPADLAFDASRREAAERDCAALGLGSETAPAERERARTLLPSRPGRAEAFGMAYVLEGSRLGARFMIKALRAEGRDADSRKDLPTHYLEASGDTRPFADLLKAMEVASLSRSEADTAVEAARTTFRYFRALALGSDIGGTAQA